MGARREIFLNELKEILQLAWESFNSSLEYVYDSTGM